MYLAIVFENLESNYNVAKAFQVHASLPRW